jgi:hypothetical protein
MPGRCARLEDQGLGLRIRCFRANIGGGTRETRNSQVGGTLLKALSAPIRQTPLTLNRFQKKADRQKRHLNSTRVRIILPKKRKNGKKWIIFSASLAW